MIEEGKIKKLNLILDLDSTLFYSIEVPRVKKIDECEDFYSKLKWCFWIRLAIQETVEFLVVLRHGLKEFLRAVKPYFRITISTLAHRYYAEKILEQIDPENEFELRKYIVSYMDDLKKSSNQ